ncbi:hypothetical protein R6Q59_025772 [Mikania micrantha]
MIMAYAVHGDAINALDLFHEMKSQKVEPNGVTFVGLLYACSHAGLIAEGRKIFASMVNNYNITPKREHYGCMVDLYGRANLLKEALEVIEQMPMAPNVVIWGSLMSACRIYNEAELGEFSAKRVLELDPYHDGAHVFLSNIYAKERKWENVGAIRKLMQNKGVVKQQGCSRIELDGEIHEFLTADKDHVRVNEIYEKLGAVVDHSNWLQAHVFVFSMVRKSYRAVETVAKPFTAEKYLKKIGLGKEDYYFWKQIGKALLCTYTVFGAMWWFNEASPLGWWTLKPVPKEEKELAHLYQRINYPYPGDEEAMTEFIAKGGMIGTMVSAKGTIEMDQGPMNYQNQLQKEKFDQEALKLWLRMKNEVIQELQEKGYDLE